MTSEISEQKELSIKEILSNYDLETLQEAFQWAERKFEDFVFIESELVDYDEGRVTTSYVYQHTPTQRYFEYSLSTDSWSDYYDDFDIEDCVEVVPVQKTITVYERR